MPKSPVFPRIVRRRSKLHGWGVFALEPINKNKRIVTYDGELIDHKESLKREGKYLKRGEIWCFTVNRKWVRDAMVGGKPPHARARAHDRRAPIGTALEDANCKRPFGPVRWFEMERV